MYKSQQRVQKDMGNETKVLQSADWKYFVGSLGNWRFWQALVLRSFFWWVVTSVMIFFIMGGMLLFFMVWDPQTVGASLPGMIKTIDQLFTLWKEIIFEFTSWFMPVISILSALISYFPVRSH